MAKRIYEVNGQKVQLNFDIVSKTYYDKSSKLKIEYYTKWTVLINGKFASNKQIAALGQFKTGGEKVNFVRPKSTRIGLVQAQKMVQTMETASFKQAFAIGSAHHKYSTRSDSLRESSRKNVYYILESQFNLPNKDLAFLYRALIGEENGSLKPLIDNDDFEDFYREYSDVVGKVFNYTSFTNKGVPDIAGKKQTAEAVVESVKKFLSKRYNYSVD